MALASLDADGLHLPDYPTVLDHVQGKFRAIYGEDLYLDPDSQDGQLTAIIAEALLDAYALAASVYNAYAPTSAQGVSLSRQVAINGLARQPATHSTVDLRLVGAVGTVLQGAVAADDQDRKWLIPDTAIPLAGEITVTAVAELPGDIRAGAGEIGKIATPILGWHSATNPDAALPGSLAETDAALRRRQAQSTALPSRTVFDGTLGAVASLAGVTRLRGYENDTGDEDDNGTPAHSICVVVEGGDNQAIAEAIAAKKGPGCGTHGDVGVLVSDRYGVPITIRFQRRVAVPLRLKVTLKPRAGYLATIGQAALDAIMAAVNGLGIGDDVLVYELYAAAKAVAGAGRVFDVLSIELARDADDLAQANVAIAYDEAAAIDVADAELVIVP